MSNVFWMKDEIIFTPSLSEGCVDGVFRRWLLEKLRDTRYELKEHACEISDLQNADEIFLTNAIRGIRPVKKFDDKNYPINKTRELIALLSKTLSYASGI
jgi:branched-chain amino acid aminotransferase